MIYIPILGAFALATATMFQKIVLRKRINIKQFQILEFLAIVVAMLPLIFFFWKVEPAALETKNLLILFAVVLISIFANIFTYYGLKNEKVNNLQPARMLEPLFIVLLAIVFSFFAADLYDKNLKVIVPAIIAGLALVFSHIRKNHLRFNKYFIATIFGSLFFALDLVTSRLILDYYNPLTFYFVRCSAILLFSYAIFHPKFGKIDKATKWRVVLLGAIWVLQRIIVYWGYTKLGVVYTTLVIMLGPVLIYAFAKIFLKEKLNWRNIIASIIILGCVLYVLLF